MPVAGWYPDPNATRRSGELRLWDGRRWTLDTRRLDPPLASAKVGAALRSTATPLILLFVVVTTTFVAVFSLGRPPRASTSPIPLTLYDDPAARAMATRLASQACRKSPVVSTSGAATCDAATVISAWPTVAERDADITALEAQGIINRTTTLIEGPTWFIECDAGDLQRIAAATGGRLRT